MCLNCNWKEAADYCEKVLGMLEDLPQEADEFASSVGEKLRSMKSWITENEHVTDKMERAIDNMGSGVEKWLSR